MPSKRKMLNLRERVMGCLEHALRNGDVDRYVIGEIESVFDYEEECNLLKAGFKPYQKLPIRILAKQMRNPFKTKTMEGVLKGKAGDYLIVGIEGEQYPCDKKVFKKTYREVRD